MKVSLFWKLLIKDFHSNGRWSPESCLSWLNHGHEARGWLRPMGLTPLKTRPFWRRMDADAGGARCVSEKVGKVGKSVLFFVFFLGGGRGKKEFWEFLDEEIFLLVWGHFGERPRLGSTLCSGEIYSWVVLLWICCETTYTVNSTLHAECFIATRWEINLEVDKWNRSHQQPGFCRIFCFFQYMAKVSVPTKMVRIFFLSFVCFFVPLVNSTPKKHCNPQEDPFPFPCCKYRIFP